MRDAILIYWALGMVVMAVGDLLLPERKLTRFEWVFFAVVAWTWWLPQMIMISREK